MKKSSFLHISFSPVLPNKNGGFVAIICFGCGVSNAAVMTQYTASGNGELCATDSGGDYIIVECDCINKKHNDTLGGLTGRQKIQDCPDDNGVTFSGTCAYHNNSYQHPVTIDNETVNLLHGHFCAAPSDAADPCKICNCVANGTVTFYDYSDNPFETVNGFIARGKIESGVAYCKQTFQNVERGCLDGMSYIANDTGRCKSCPSQDGSSSYAYAKDYGVNGITDCYMSSGYSMFGPDGEYTFTQDCYYTE